MRSAKEEILQSPVSLILSALNAVAAIGALLVALRQGGPSFAPPPSSSPPNSGAYLIAVAGFLSITTTAALLSRLVNNHSGVSSYFASILAASLSTFLTFLVIRTQGVRFDGGQNISQDSAIIYWGTLLIFLAINAERVTDGYRDWNKATLQEDANATDQAAGAAMMLGALLIVWALAVWKGQELLTSHLG